MGIGLFSNLAPANAEGSVPDLVRKVSFHKYNPCSFDIKNDFKELSVIYSERLGTADILLVQNKEN